MAEPLKRFGQNVRNARSEKGWTQEDLAARANLAPVQISRIERGVREIRLSTLIKLIDALGIEANVILAGVSSKKS